MSVITKDGLALVEEKSIESYKANLIKELEKEYCSICNSTDIQKRKFMNGNYPVCNYICNKCDRPVTVKKLSKEDCIELIKQTK